MNINSKLLDRIRQAKLFWLKDEFKSKYRFKAVCRTVLPSKHYNEVQLKLDF